MKKKVKHLFVTGGVVSSLGKGVTAASIALLLIRRGYKVAIQKLDPYLNIDPGTMSPYQHGEVYVTEDGCETDLDLGHYERFTGLECNHHSNYTSGRIYQEVLNKERRGDYLGRTVQVIPHVTNEIKKAISNLEEDVDIAITEIGGTVGDIESLPYLEAIRQYGKEVGRENVIYVHLAYIPYLKAAEELKTKPAQHSISKLREIGITADFLVCRGEVNFGDDILEKLSLFCNVVRENIIKEIDVQHTIYEIPNELYEQKLDVNILKAFSLPTKTINLDDWNSMVKNFIAYKKMSKVVVIGMLGKYAEFPDAYKSVHEALTHAGIANEVRIQIKYINTEKITNQLETKQVIGDLQAVLVPGGFGERGVEGKIQVIQYVRENKIPFLGICLGMQCAVIEYARNVCGLKNAHSREFFEIEKDFVIDYMGNQKNIVNLGGTMRLGNFDCEIVSESKAYEAYKTTRISERHRHRLEFNNKYKEQLEKKGLIFSGINPQESLVEIVEIADHPWFLACQFHPEFKSTPLNSHPLFIDFIANSK